MSGSGSASPTASGRDIIVIGFSAGGVDPVVRLVAELPADFAAAVFIVHHFPAKSISALPHIVSRAGPLPADHPQHGERVFPGRIYIAPPNRHMLLGEGRIHLTNGPREHGHRPAVDPLFRTAARVYGARAVGVLLSGTLDDGTEGLLAIKRHHGVTVVQDPAEALYPGMPNSAILEVGVDHVKPVERIGSLLVELASQPVAHLVQGNLLAPLDPPNRRRGLRRSAERFEQSVEEAERGSTELRRLLLRGVAGPPIAPEEAEIVGQADQESSASGDRRR
jgi:chemotaxis response regulator CheB